MNVEIWSLGKENDAFIEEGMRYYFKKTKPWNPIELVVLQTAKKAATTDVERTKVQEEELILKKLQAGHYLILLDERGKKLNSIQWSQQFQQCMNQGTKTLIILIGGAFGVTDVVKKEQTRYGLYQISCSRTRWSGLLWQSRSTVHSVYSITLLTITCKLPGERNVKFQFIVL